MPPYSYDEYAIEYSRIFSPLLLLHALCIILLILHNFDSHSSPSPPSNISLLSLSLTLYLSLQSMCLAFYSRYDSSRYFPVTFTRQLQLHLCLSRRLLSSTHRCIFDQLTKHQVYGMDKVWEWKCHVCMSGFSIIKSRQTTGFQHSYHSCYVVVEFNGVFPSSFDDFCQTTEWFSNSRMYDAIHNVYVFQS